MITDHHLLLCNVHHPKPHLQKTKIITRAFRSIDLPSFRTDISQRLGDPDDNLSVTDLMDIYDTQLTNVLNKHAPSKEKSIVIRPQQPRFSCFFKEKIDKIRDDLPDCSDINLEIVTTVTTCFHSECSAEYYRGGSMEDNLQVSCKKLHA